MLSLLGSAARPLARRVECWLPDGSASHLMRASGHCEVQGRLGADAAARVPTVVQHAWRRQAACIETDADSAWLALPIVGDDDGVNEVVALRL